MIKVVWVSSAFLHGYGAGNGMYRWRIGNGKITDKCIFLGEDANAWTLLHEFIHYLNQLFKLPQFILDFMDVIMHPRWWFAYHGKIVTGLNRDTYKKVLCDKDGWKVEETPK